MNGFKQQWKKIIVTGAAAGALIIGAAVVNAQEGESPVPVQPDASGQPGDVFGFGGRGGNGGPGGRGGDGLGGGRGGNGRGGDGAVAGEMIERVGNRFLVAQVASALGVLQRDVTEQLRGDTTLAQIVSDAGGDASAIIAAAVAAATEDINQAVANGRLTQANADLLLANVETRFTEAFNASPVETRVFNQGERMAIEYAAELLSLDRRELVTELAGGRSLADVLTAGGVDVDTYLADVSVRLQARLNVAVVEGNITAERADELLASFEAYLQGRINEVFGTAQAADAASA